jgi:iron complex transport system permease protein
MRYYPAFILLFVMLVGLFLANLSLGSVSIPFSEIVKILTGKDANPIWENIVWDFRMTKALTCILTGAALSVSGLQMQTLFRNALAGPDVLGLTSGASLAVSLVYMGQTAGILLLVGGSSWTVAIAASIGCAVVFMMMFALAGRLRDNASLLIVGLMVGAGTSSIVSILQYISTAEELQTYLIWTFGSLGTLSWQEIKILGVVFVVGSAVSFLTVKSLNAWLLGENYARSLGINTRRARIATLLSASLLTGGVTAFCGPIAFVGLAVPHLVKMLIKTHDHKTLLPAVILGGAILVLFCDIVAQLPGATQVLPINAITAIIGAPIVVWVIIHNRIVQ